MDEGHKMVIQKRNANEYETDGKVSNLPIKQMQIKMTHHFFYYQNGKY